MRAWLNNDVIVSDETLAGHAQMREFILLAEGYLAHGLDETFVEEVSETVVEHNTVLISDLNDVVYRLRAFMETETGEFALGVETGMQRAADMIENLIKRHTGGDDLGL